MNKLTPEYLESLIGTVEYHYSELATVCIATTIHGFKLVGMSAPLSASNYCRETGEQIALSNAREQLWQLEGYYAKRSASISPIPAQ